jgi:geranylgeranyl reductase family protein
VIRCDALVVGGGPAGSTCARILRKAGWTVIVADRARFPRDKVCAGWLTPEVFPLLGLDPAEYRASGGTLQEITGFRTGVIGTPLVETRYDRTVSYAIRRCEFDDFLLRRAEVRVLDATPVVSLRRGPRGWIANDEIETRVIVGAGGHFCPVARQIGGGPDTTHPIVAREAEFRLPRNETHVAASTPQLLFSRDLRGYAWCVQKGDYLNVGIGHRDSSHFNRRLDEFMEYLGRALKLRQPPDARWRGHAYLASGAGARPFIGEGVLLVGDAAGLAYPKSGEGIRPAIESGRLAADALIAANGRYGVDDLQPYADSLRRLHPPSPEGAGHHRTASAAVGRVLLGSAFFTRRILLDRWFLQTHGRRRAAGLPPDATTPACAL